MLTPIEIERKVLKTGIGYLNNKPQPDAQLSSGRTPAARARTFTSSYIKYSEMRSQLEEIRKNNEALSKERDKYQRLLEAEKLRNDKLNARIEKLLDRLEAVPAL